MYFFLYSGIVECLFKIEGESEIKNFFLNVLLLEPEHQINLWVVFGSDCQAIWMIQSVASIFYITIIYMFWALLLDIYLLLNEMCSSLLEFSKALSTGFYQFWKVTSISTCSWISKQPVAFCHSLFFSMSMSSSI